MPTVLLVRHGRTAANAGGTLAGWTPGIGLDETGAEQARRLAERMSVVTLAGIVCSPLQRCRETTAAIRAVPGPPPPRRKTPAPRPEPVTDDRLGECRYGDWTGRPLRELAKEPLWRVVQAHPSAATFPGPEGESMLAMQGRAVAAIREHDARIATSHGPDAVWMAVSHGDIIKSILADALGMHFDSFQRLVAEPCSVSAIRYTPLRPFALRVNDTGGDLTPFAPAPPTRRRTAHPRASLEAASAALVGGGGGGDGGGVAATP